jgi:hypothetical protein
MPRRRQGSVPSLQHHKASGRARVWIKGRDYWLGKWGSPEAQLAYNRLIGEYLATGRIDSTRTEPVAELGTLYLEYCQTYYRDPSGRQTSTYGNALQASPAFKGVLNSTVLVTRLRPHADELPETFPSS